MVWCNKCDVTVLSKKRYLCKGDGEAWRSLEICAARWMRFQNYWRSEREPLGVWIGPLYIESSYVTRSKLSWREKIANKEKSLTKQVVSLEGFFFSQKKRARDFKVDGTATTAVNHSYHSWLMTSFAWKTILGIKFMIWLKMVR